MYNPLKTQLFNKIRSKNKALIPLFKIRYSLYYFLTLV